MLHNQNEVSVSAKWVINNKAEKNVVQKNPYSAVLYF